MMASMGAKFIFELVFTLGLSLAALLLALKISAKSKAGGYAVASVGFVFLLYAATALIFSVWSAIDLSTEIYYDTATGLAFLFPGAAIPILNRQFQKHPERQLSRLLNVALMTILFACCSFWVLFDKVYLACYWKEIASLNGKVVDGVVLQSTGYSCYPSSTATVLRMWGVNCTEGDVAIRSRTTTRGTNSCGILKAIRDLGGERGLQYLRTTATLDEILAANRPVILSVKVGAINHAIALIGVDGDQIILGEPLHGRDTIDKSVLYSSYRWSGETIFIGKNFTSTLYGDERQEVLQSLVADLRQLGLLPNSPNWPSQSEIKSAITKFQAQKHLPETGVATPKTRLALDSAAHPKDGPTLTQPQP